MVTTNSTNLPNPSTSLSARSPIPELVRLPGGMKVPSLTFPAQGSARAAYIPVDSPDSTVEVSSSYSNEIATKEVATKQPTDDGHVYFELWRDVVRYQFVYSVVALFLGLCCIVAGTVLFLLGVTGQSSWTVKLLGARSELADAAPGTILFVVGLFYVFITRFVVKPAK